MPFVNINSQETSCEGFVVALMREGLRTSRFHSTSHQAQPQYINLTTTMCLDKTMAGFREGLQGKAANLQTRERIYTYVADVLQVKPTKNCGPYRKPEVSLLVQKPDGPIEHQRIGRPRRVGGHQPPRPFIHLVEPLQAHQYQDEQRRELQEREPPHLKAKEQYRP